MDMTYRILVDEDDYRSLYARLRAENLLWAFWPDVDPGDWSCDRMARMLSRPDELVVAGYADGTLAGLMLVWPFSARSNCAEVGLTAFRGFFPVAAGLCRGALLFACDELNPASFVGRVPAPSRHILRMLGQVGFCEIARIPGLCWYTRKQRFVDGVLAMATPDSIRAATLRKEQ